MLTARTRAVLLPVGGKHTVLLLGGKDAAPTLIHKAFAASLTTALSQQDGTLTSTPRFVCCRTLLLFPALKASAELGKPEIVSLILKQYPDQSKNHCKAAVFRALK